MPSPFDMSNSQKITVLLADDDQDDQFLFRHAIERLGVPIMLVTANNGLDVIEYLQCPTNPIPHMIFLDINMPVLNGFECLSKIRDIQKCCQLPVAIYSTSSEKKDFEEAFRRGANTCITKPCGISDLKDVLRNILVKNQDRLCNIDTDSFSTY